MAKASFTDAASLDLSLAVRELSVHKRRATTLELNLLAALLGAADILAQHNRSTTEHDRRRAHARAASVSGVVAFVINPEGRATHFSRAVECAAMAIAAICEGNEREASALTMSVRHMVRRLNREAVALAPAYVAA